MKYKIICMTLAIIIFLLTFVIGLNIGSKVFENFTPQESCIIKEDIL